MLKTTVVMKTDIGDFTSRVSKLSGPRLDAMLLNHNETVREGVARYSGVIIKGEGDSFWVTFESVTDACLAAIAIQQSVNESSANTFNGTTLAIRIVIHVGDILIQNNDIFGESVNFTARMEQITPVNEIYLSETAYHILNKNEVAAEYVNAFQFKGFDEQYRIFKIKDIFHSRQILNQVLVITDIQGFTSYVEKETVGNIENFVISHRKLHEESCKNNAGQIRLREGDSFLLTFEDPDKALSAMIDLILHWEAYLFENSEFSPGIDISIHIGDFTIFDSVMFGEDINVVGAISGMIRQRANASTNTIYISEDVLGALKNHNYKKRCEIIKDDTNHEIIIRGQKIFSLKYR